jgi:hypothetical protein
MRSWLRINAIPLTCVLLFLFSYGARRQIARGSPRTVIDLEIYRAGGELIAKGINPYDYTDGVAVRQEIARQRRNGLPRVHLRTMPNPASAHVDW